VLRLTKMDYAIDESLERIRRIDAQLAELKTRVSDPAALKLAAEIRGQLQPIRLDLQPTPLSPQHLNLRPRVRQLTWQVADYTGRPTAAQETYIGIFEGRVGGVVKRLNAVVAGNLAQLNARLAALHTPYVSPEPQLAVGP
jgi:hypothetical protein